MILTLFPLLADATQVAGSAASEVTITDVFSCVRDIIVAIVSIAGLIIAFRGLRTWRKQLKGNTEYNLARRLLRAAFRTRDALSIVRNFHMPAAEIAQAMNSVDQADENDGSKATKLDVHALVYNQRWRAVTEALSDLDVERLESETIWGPAVVVALKPLHDSVSKLRAAIDRFLRHNTREREGRCPALTEETIEELDRVIYQRSTDPAEDSFTAEVHAAIGTLEEFVKPKLIL